MSYLSLHLIHLMLVFVIGFNSGDELPRDDVLVLTNKNFKKIMESNKDLLVMFYAPWCSHSQAMMKDFAEVAKELADLGSPVKLAKIDSTKALRLQKKYGVRGYPTLKFFKDGKPFDYTGGRDTESLLSFVKSNSS